VEAVELERVSHADWLEVVAGEQDPWGAEGAAFRWRDKQRHVGIRGDDGRLQALAGTVVAAVRVGGEAPDRGGERFEVVGIGGVIVTREQRGRGLARILIERTLELAAAQGPERAMLFCLPELMGLYARFSFSPVQAEAWADQPGGRVRLPMRAMWRALRPGAGWPPGRVDVEGEPF